MTSPAATFSFCRASIILAPVVMVVVVVGVGVSVVVVQTKQTTRGGGGGFMACTHTYPNTYPQKHPGHPTRNTSTHKHAPAPPTRPKPHTYKTHKTDTHPRHRTRHTHQHTHKTPACRRPGLRRRTQVVHRLHLRRAQRDAPRLVPAPRGGVHLLFYVCLWKCGVYGEYERCRAVQSIRVIDDGRPCIHANDLHAHIYKYIQSITSPQPETKNAPAPPPPPPR